MNRKQRKMLMGFVPAVVSKQNERYLVIKPGHFNNGPIFRKGEIYSYKELYLINQAIELELGCSVDAIVEETKELQA
jgi:hypothetical protein